jgi:lysyl-tRNA synthetase class 2
VKHDWQPAAPLHVMRLRARMYADIRAYFARHGVLEVETPLLSHAATPDPRLHSLRTDYHGPHGGRCYLHTSPEYPMKRLLAAGSGSIYQITRVFRDGEAGNRHNPEFSLLEWYRVGFSLEELMHEVAGLVSRVLRDIVPLQGEEYLGYAEAFRRYAGIDPFTASIAQLRDCARCNGIGDAASLHLADRDAWLDLLLGVVVAPGLGRARMTFLHDYPASQAALARLSPDKPHCAERFELFIEGVELANGFHELTDAAEQRRRFDRELEQRVQQGLDEVPLDNRFLQALEHGLPDCAGVALGLDRLLMLLAGVDSIGEVLAFPVGRA